MAVRNQTNKPVDEKLTDEEYGMVSDQQLLTEHDVVQREVITKIPGTITFLMQYELKPLLKIIGSIGVMAALWFFVGWDAVASAVILFAFIAGISYWLQKRSQSKDMTIYVEMRLPGQLIEPSDFSPYSEPFYTVTKQFAVWAVPNTLIAHGLFKQPGEQGSSALPGSDHVKFVDYFDRINRTCVLPRDMDVANIALPTNANPMVAQKMQDVGEQILLDKETESTIKAAYSMGELDGNSAAKMLRPIKVRQRALMSPTSKTRRDIFFELQATIPELREKLQEISNSIFLLADFIAAKGIYQTINRPMPEEIRNDHNTLYKLIGLPTIRKQKKRH
jgi:hypothetical protein